MAENSQKTRTKKKGKGGPKPGPRKTEERRKIVLEFIETVGVDNIDKSKLAKKLNTNRGTIAKDIQYWLERINIITDESIQNDQFECLRAFRHMKKKAREGFVNNVGREQRAWGEFYEKTLREERHYFQEIGIAERQVEDTNIGEVLDYWWKRDKKVHKKILEGLKETREVRLET